MRAEQTVRVITKDGLVVRGRLHRSILGLIYLVEHDNSSGLFAELDSALAGGRVAHWYPRWRIIFTSKESVS